MAENNKIVKYRKPFHLNIGIIVFGIILIYVLFNVFSYFTKKQIGMYEVTQGTIAENNTYEGLILRSETVYYSQYDGQLNYYLSDNTKAACNNLIYSVDSTGEVSSQMATIADSNADLNSAYFKNLKDDIASYIAGYESKSFYNVYAFKDEVSSKITEAVNQSSLNDVSDSVAAATANDTFHLAYATEPGIVAYYTDGYEGMTLDNFTPDAINALDYHKNITKNNSEISAGAPVYKLITNEDWNVICAISDETHASLTETTVIEVKFKKDNTTCWVNYELRDIDGKHYVILQFHNNMIRFANDRYIDIELLINEKSGLKIPNSSIVEKSFFTVPKEYFTKGGDSNSLGLYLVDSNAGSVTFIAPTIYYATDTSYYIDDELVTSGDSVQRPDSNETYTVQEEDTLQGVYNINKGYAVFKQIEILFQNKEYTIVKTGTDYGITLYDHIALEGSDVSEDDLIN